MNMSTHACGHSGGVCGGQGCAFREAARYSRKARGSGCKYQLYNLLVI